MKNEAKAIHVALAAIISICLLEVIALSHGINGAILRLSIGAITAIGSGFYGFKLGKKGTTNE